MANTRIIKQRISTDGSYLLSPRPSRADRARAIQLLREAAEQAEAIVAEAQARAAALLEEAERQRETERERLLAQLRATALAEAREEVQAQLQAEIDETFLRFRALVDRAIVDETEIRRACHAELVNLAVAVAERILRREIERDETFVARIAELALAHAPAAPVTHVFVHPDDVPVMEPWAREAFRGREADTPVRVVGDLHIDRGGCVIGTRTGFINAQLEVQLLEVRRALAEVAADA